MVAMPIKEFILRYRLGKPSYVIYTTAIYWWAHVAHPLLSNSTKQLFMSDHIHALTGAMAYADAYVIGVMHVHYNQPVLLSNVLTGYGPQHPSLKI